MFLYVLGTPDKFMMMPTEDLMDIQKITGY